VQPSLPPPYPSGPPTRSSPAAAAVARALAQEAPCAFRGQVALRACAAPSRHAPLLECNPRTAIPLWQRLEPPLPPGPTSSSLHPPLGPGTRIPAPAALFCRRSHMALPSCHNASSAPLAPPARAPCRPYASSARGGQTVAHRSALLQPHRGPCKLTEFTVAPALCDAGPGPSCGRPQARLRPPTDG
jgi:hypothetical protein